MGLPHTLHGQLYLMAYDRNRHRFDTTRLWLLGFALRAAMLTDLYLTGYVEDEDGKACPIRHTYPPDPLLAAMFDTVKSNPDRAWMWLIAAGQESAPRLVGEQLTEQGWIGPQRRWMLGVIPRRRSGPYDEGVVVDLTDGAAQAVRNIMSGRSADPRPLAVGLLGILSEMPTVFSDVERARHHLALRDMALAAIAPITGLHEAVESFYADVSGKGGGCGGTCGGGGCGGGCGGCGG